MSDGRRGPAEDWVEISARAARATGYRPPEADRRPRAASSWPIGILAIAVVAVVFALAQRPATTVGPVASDLGVMSGQPSTQPSPTAAASPVVGPSRTPPAPGSPAPAVGAAEDGTFRLMLTAPQGTVGPLDRIEPVALITYLGPDGGTTIYHASSPVGFTITEVDGPRFMGGGMALPCLHTRIARDVPIAYPFEKAGSPDEGGFDIAWYTDPVLRLPVGPWRIRAMLSVDLADGGATCGGIHHQLDAEIEVTVR